MLDLDYRARQLAFRRKQIAEWMENELEGLRGDPDAAELIAEVEREATRQEKDALATYGMLEGADPRVAPLRRALAVWGLTADDIGVVSIHGTSTKANVSTSALFSRGLELIIGFTRTSTSLTSTMTSSLQFSAPLATPSLLLRRRISPVTRRAPLRPGCYLVSVRVSIPVSSLETATPSMYPEYLTRGSFTNLILQQH